MGQYDNGGGGGGGGGGTPQITEYVTVYGDGSGSVSMSYPTVSDTYYFNANGDIIGTASGAGDYVLPGVYFNWAADQEDIQLQTDTQIAMQAGVSQTQLDYIHRDAIMNTFMQKISASAGVAFLVQVMEGIPVLEAETNVAQAAHVTHMVNEFFDFDRSVKENEILGLEAATNNMNLYNSGYYNQQPGDPVQFWSGGSAP